jgi:aryl-alcohol dehydrogenase-like predicted oxidoreductase
MKYRPLGRTGQFVSEICLGTMTFHGDSSSTFWRNVGSLEQSAATAIVERALAAGVNFIDTADVYSEGYSEILLGQALRDLSVKREDVIVATKVRGRTGPGPNAVGLSRGHIMDQVAGSLKRLQLDYIDLYQIHGYRGDFARARRSRLARVGAHHRLLEHGGLADHEGARHFLGERLCAL